MKTNYTIIITLLLVVYGFLPQQASAQSPQKMSYQAVIRNSSDALVTYTSVGMKISILQGSSTGTVVYTETQNPTTNTNGLVSIEIGGGAGFSTIDWANDIYFIKTETDPTGGTNYAIAGTSQLMSVPYALHAKTAETITETDPIYTASQAANITSTDITNLSNLTGVNTGDQDISGIATNASAIALNTDKVGVTLGTTAGQMQYWNGTTWVTIASGNDGQILTLISGVPTWVGGITPNVINPTTGKIWMAYNLGATDAATSSTDAASYGYLYQWGRDTDGHQLRTSETTTALSSTDMPGHGDFILAPSSPYNWRSPQNTNLWQVVNGVNNPCPTGYRIPTDTELDAERSSWSSQDGAGAFASPLKLPLAGIRTWLGGFDGVGSVGYYWSSTVVGNDEWPSNLQFDGSNSSAHMDNHPRAAAYSIRCVKD
jgi:uncharacterized protein (TIGR02145 family)